MSPLGETSTTRRIDSVAENAWLRLTARSLTVLVSVVGPALLAIVFNDIKSDIASVKTGLDVYASRLGTTEQKVAGHDATLVAIDGRLTRVENAQAALIAPLRRGERD